MGLTSLVIAALIELNPFLGLPVQIEARNVQQGVLQETNGSRPFFPLESIKLEPYEEIRTARENGKERKYIEKKVRWVSNPKDYGINCRVPITDKDNLGYRAQICTAEENGKPMNMIGIQIPPTKTGKKGIEEFIESSSPIAVFYDMGQNGFGKEDNARFFLVKDGFIIADYTLGWNPGNGYQVQSWNIRCPMPGQVSYHNDNHGWLVTSVVYGKIRSAFGGYKNLQDADYIDSGQIKGIIYRLRERFAKRFTDDIEKQAITNPVIECKSASSF